MARLQRVLLCLAAVLSLAACEAQPKGDKAPLPHLEVLESIGSRMCACRMAGRDDHALRAEWQRLTSNLRIEGYATASFPLEAEMNCFPQIGDTACVVSAIKVVESPQDFLCTDAQADELDTIWNKQLPPKPRDSIAADAALLKHLREMRSELTRSLSQSDCDTL